MSLGENFFPKSRDLLNDFRFDDLFIQELGWSQPATTKTITLKIESQTYAYSMIAQFSGVLVFQVNAENEQIADGKLCKAIYQEIEQLYRENLLIFVDRDRSRSLWYWVKRDGTKRYIRDHLYIKGQPGYLFLSKLSSLVVELSDWELGEPSVIQIADKLKTGFDVERVTKKFYQEFKEEHYNFLAYIQGIDRESDRRWYTSVMLNRLMFVYFLQRKGFLDRGNLDYLQNQLPELFAKNARRDNQQHWLVKPLWPEFDDAGELIHVDFHQVTKAADVRTSKAINLSGIEG